MLPGHVVLGFVVGLLWMALIGAQAISFRGYGWATLVGGLIAGAVAGALVRFGDRGVAVGVAGASGLGIAVAAVMVIVRWSSSGWPLW